MRQVSVRLRLAPRRQRPATQPAPVGACAATGFGLKLAVSFGVFVGAFPCAASSGLVVSVASPRVPLGFRFTLSLLMSFRAMGYGGTQICRRGTPAFCAFSISMYFFTYVPRLKVRFL